MEFIQHLECQKKVAGTGIIINIFYHGNGALVISAQDHHGRTTHAGVGDAVIIEKQQYRYAQTFHQQGTSCHVPVFKPLKTDTALNTQPTRLTGSVS